MNLLHLYNPNHMESTQLHHHHPQSHGIHNPKKKKKLPKPTTIHKHSPPPPPTTTGTTRHHQQQSTHHHPILLNKKKNPQNQHKTLNEVMNQLHLYNPNHMESTQLHHHPQSHGIHNRGGKKKSPNLNVISTN